MTDGVSSLALRREVTRKLLHLMWIVIPVAYAAGMDRRLLIMGLGAATVTAVVVEIARFRVASIGSAFDRATGPLLRSHERRAWSGATWLLVSFLLVVVLFPRGIAVAAMWAVAAGDTAAALVGRAFGGPRIGRARKTLRGSVACAVTTGLGALLVARLPIAESVIGSLVAAAAEWPSGPVDDNLRIGLAVGVGILLSHMAFS